MRRARASVLTLGALLWLAGQALAGPPDPFEALGLMRFDSGIRAPDFTLPDLEGHPVGVSSTAGPAALVVFWATW